MKIIKNALGTFGSISTELKNNNYFSIIITEKKRLIFMSKDNLNSIKTKTIFVWIQVKASKKNNICLSFKFQNKINNRNPFPIAGKVYQTLERIVKVRGTEKAFQNCLLKASTDYFADF
jgi:hypothetical protein